MKGTTTLTCILTAFVMCAIVDDLKYTPDHRTDAKDVRGIVITKYAEKADSLYDSTYYVCFYSDSVKKLIKAPVPYGYYLFLGDDDSTLPLEIALSFTPKEFADLEKYDFRGVKIHNY